jgi:hypothetical protein
MKEDLRHLMFVQLMKQNMSAHHYSYLALKYFYVGKLNQVSPIKMYKVLSENKI